MTQDPHQTINGMKILFGYFDPEDKCWYIPPRRFILIENTDLRKLQGDFIQSTWFNKLFKLGDDLSFMVITVEQNKSAKDIEKDLNKLRNPFPTSHDIPYYLNNTGYYIMDQNIMIRSIRQFNHTSSFNFTLKSTINPFQTLTLKLIKNDNNPQSMFITTPSFTNRMSFSS